MLRLALFACVAVVAPGFVLLAWFAVCAVAAKLQIVISMSVQNICSLIKAKYLLISKSIVLVRRRGFCRRCVLRGCRVLFEPLLQLLDVSL